MSSFNYSDLASGSELHRLSATALIGTARANTQTPTLLGDSSTDSTQQEISNTELVPNTSITEESLLKKVASVSLQHQVASLALKSNQTTTPDSTKQTDEAPYCSPQAIRRLGLMLEGKHTDLTAEFLKLVHASNQRIPEVYAPNLLYRAHRQASLRGLVIPAFGSVAIKLAQSNPQWAFASLELNNWDGLKDYWKSERSANRRHLLSQLRGKAPAIALDLLESTWSKETPSAKSWYLRSMLENLSMADEPFLEAALDDRQHTVRKKAAEILTHLPDSRLCKRMIDSAGKLLKLTDNLEAGIEVEYPPINTAMIRDGVPQRWDKDTDKAKKSQIGEMISSIPLDHWEQEFALAPDDIVKAITHSGDWYDALVRGFATATFRQANAVWAKALLEGMPPNLHINKLVNYLSTADFIALLDSREDKDLLLDKNNPKLKLLQRWSKPWTPELTQSVLDHVRPAPELIGKSNKSDKSKPPPALLRQILKATSTLAPVQDTELLQEVRDCLESFKALSPAWKHICINVDETLAFRHDMHAELTTLPETISQKTNSQENL